MKVFVTVGSTHFPALIESLFRIDTLNALREQGCIEITVQYGRDHALFHQLQSTLNDDIRVSGFDYAPSIDSYMKEADLIISHAGSGSVLEALDYEKLLIAVPNETLMDNHQLQLANAMAEKGYLIASSVKDVAQAIAQCRAFQHVPFPRTGSSTFAALMKQEIGVQD